MWIVWGGTNERAYREKMRQVSGEQKLKNQREVANKVAFVNYLRLVEEEEIILRLRY